MTLSATWHTNFAKFETNLGNGRPTWRAFPKNENFSEHLILALGPPLDRVVESRRHVVVRFLAVGAHGVPLVREAGGHLEQPFAQLLSALVDHLTRAHQTGVFGSLHTLRRLPHAPIARLCDGRVVVRFGVFVPLILTRR